MNERKPEDNVCPYCLSPLGPKGVCRTCKRKYKTADFPPRHLPPFTVLKRRYTVGAALGEGGFGVTYIGRDEMSGELVAIKEYYPSALITRQADGSLLPKTADVRMKFMLGKTRFTAEAKNMAAVRRLEGIASVLDFFSENETVYIVMEYLDGVTLGQYLAKSGKLPFSRAFALLKPVMEALRRLHDAGFVHGDVSPDNIMITRGEECRLIDFGAAVHADVFGGSRTVTLKKRFAPPEQYNAGTVLGRQTDVYAMGVTLYYCVTAALPPESTERLYKDELKSPSHAGAKITKEEEAALTVALKPEKESRYPDMQRMTKALSDAVALDPHAAADSRDRRDILGRLLAAKK